MKALISAFSCGPGEGSEPGVGWNWVLQISKHHDVWLITTDEYQEALERELPDNVHATFLPSYRLWARLQELPIPGLDWAYYYWWQWKAYRAAAKLHLRTRFDIAHHVTLASWRAPSFLCLLPIPLVWGPVGGGGTVPHELRSQLGWKGRIFEGFRQFAQQISRWDPFVRETMKRAGAIIAANNETADLVPGPSNSKVSIMATGGMSELEMVKAEPPMERPEGFVIIFVAMLRPLKGGALAIRAMRHLLRSRTDATLIVIGGGSDHERLRNLAEELGVSDRVRFLGKLPRHVVLGWMQSSDVLLFPSLRDSGPLVILEAMSAGKPVVCLDLGGPEYFVTKECGFRVQPASPEEVILGLSAALDKLANDPALRQSMGAAGRRRVMEEFDWNTRGEQMQQIYRKLVKGP